MKLEHVTPIAPPIPGQWHWPSDAIRLVLKARLQAVEYTPLIFSTLAALRICPLSFYPGWMLCDWQCDDHGSVWASMLYGPDGFTPLDGTSLPMHDHNRLHGVILENDSARLDYLRFFTWFVRGNDVPFELVESANGLSSTDGALDNEALAALCRAPQLQEADPPEETATTAHWHASVLFGNTLFHSVFSIAESGVVEMVSDNTVANNIERQPALRYDGCVRSDISSAASDHSPSGEQQ